MPLIRQRLRYRQFMLASEAPRDASAMARDAVGRGLFDFEALRPQVTEMRRLMPAMPSSFRWQQCGVAPEETCRGSPRRRRCSPCRDFGDGHDFDLFSHFWRFHISAVIAAFGLLKRLPRRFGRYGRLLFRARFAGVAKAPTSAGAGGIAMAGDVVIDGWRIRDSVCAVSASLMERYADFGRRRNAKFLSAAFITAARGSLHTHRAALADIMR